MSLERVRESSSLEAIHSRAEKINPQPTRTATRPTLLMSQLGTPTSAKLISRPAPVKTVTNAHQISRNRRDRRTGPCTEYILGRVWRDFSILRQCSGMSPEQRRCSSLVGSGLEHSGVDREVRVPGGEEEVPLNDWHRVFSPFVLDLDISGSRRGFVAVAEHSKVFVRRRPRRDIDQA